MTPKPAAAERPSAQLIDQLGAICRGRGLRDLANRLTDLQAWISSELRDFEAELAAIPRGVRVVQRAANHLLDLDGKHLRPMCVALASKVGDGFGEDARLIAVAVEMVHTATLLHDDVVDLGDQRRGAPAARCIYGNAASVFAGDWLLVQAMQRVRSANVPGALDRLLTTINEMILAESLQLERRGQLVPDVTSYYRVVEGKTAALFRWAMWAGGRAGGLTVHSCEALEEYGLHLGVAFQAVDDLLDFTGNAAFTGKTLYSDLREGKITYPLVLALQRDAGLAPIIERGLAAGDNELPDTVARSVAASLERTGAIADCRAMAADRVRLAVAALDGLPDDEARTALITVAQATALRQR